MMKKIKTEGFTGKRLLSIQEACLYTGLGHTSCRKMCDTIGAVKKIGSRVLFDREAIDKAIENMY